MNPREDGERVTRQPADDAVADVRRQSSQDSRAVHPGVVVKVPSRSGCIIAACLTIFVFCGLGSFLAYRL